MEKSQKIPQTFFESPNLINSVLDSQSYNNYPSTRQSASNLTTNNNIYNSNLNEQPLFFPNNISNNSFQWRDLMKLNINDVDSYQPYFPQLLNSNISRNEVLNLPEEYILNLIKMLQGIANKTLYEKNLLLEDNKKMNDMINNYNLHNKEIINLKEKIKLKENEMERIKNLLKKTKKGLINEDEEENNKNCLFYCHFCENKKFKTEQYLEDHMRRRHLYSYQKMNKSNKKDYENDFNEKINLMKNEFEKVLKQNKYNYEYNRINDKISSLELFISNQNLNNSNNPNMFSSAYINDNNNNINNNNLNQN